VGAAGELYSIRTSLFSPLENHLIIDDFIISMQVCLAGFRMAYEPGAFAVEAPSLSLAEEKKRKIRIAAGAFQSISHLKQCLNFVKYPLLSFQYFSRRILRWVACPILLVLLFISNALLVAGNQGLIFNYFFFGQSVFYILAMAGRLAKFSKWKLGIFNIPFYFVFMNLCLARGFFKYINRQQTVIWEKAMREIAPE
jgi:cellulose synthase/poly-beta-1,6-N-acetylglucosamine synthase-like glycosyltransferase